MDISNGRSTNPFRVYIVGGGYEYVRFMYGLRYAGAKNVEDAEIVLFTGGEDVSPSLYGETALQCTRYNPMRDEKEQAIYRRCIERGIPMVGICRGGQFLNVMNGGKMWQNVNNHCRNHLLVDMNGVPDGKKPDNPRTIEVTSTHHQMMIPNEELAVVLGIAFESTSKQSFKQSIEMDKPDQDIDYEVIWYPRTKSMCFQPHPEFADAPKELVKYFDELLDQYIIPEALSVETPNKEVA